MFKIPIKVLDNCSLLSLTRAISLFPYMEMPMYPKITNHCTIELEKALTPNPSAPMTRVVYGTTIIGINKVNT